MPINEVELQIETQGALPDCAGTVRKGEEGEEKTKTVDGKEVPYKSVGKDRASFRIVLKSQYAWLAEHIKELYGDNPVEFDDVVILGKSPGHMLDYWYEQWTSGLPLVKCDGVTQVLHKEGVNTSRVPTPCACELAGQRACRPHGTMRIMLMRLNAKIERFVYFVVETGSMHDVKRLRNSIAHSADLYGNALSHVVWILGRAPDMITVPMKGGKTGRKKSHLLYVSPNPEFSAHAMALVQRQREMLITGQVDLATGQMLNAPEMLSMSANVPNPADEPPYEPMLDEEEDIPPVQNWNEDDVNAAVGSLFNHPMHLHNLLENLTRASVVTDEMTTEEVIAIVKTNRRDKELTSLDAAAKDSAFWVKQTDVQTFAQQIFDRYKLKPQQIIDAINMVVDGYPKEKMSEFAGLVSKSDAVALCIIYLFESDFKAAREFAIEKKVHETIVGAIGRFELDAHFVHPF